MQALKANLLHIFLGILLLLGGYYHCDAKGDSTLERQYDYLFEQMNAYTYSDIDSSRYFAEKLLNLGLQNGDSMVIAEAYSGMGYVHFFRNRPTQAWDFFKKSEEIYLKMQDTIGLSYAYLDLGNAAVALGSYKQSIRYYLLSEQFLPETGYYVSNRAYIFYNIARTFLDFEDYINAMPYIDSCEKYVHEDTLDDLLPAINNLRAVVFLHTGDTEEAEKMASKALSQSLTQKDLTEKAYSLQLLAECALASQNFDEAIKYQSQSIEVTTEYGDPYLELMAYVGMSKVYRLAGKPKKALEMAEKANLLAKNEHSWIALKDVYEAYSKALEVNGKYKPALEALQLYTAYNDSLGKFNISENILSERNEIMQKSNLKLTAQTSRQSNVISRNKLIVLILVVGLILSIGAISVALFNIKKKKEANLLLSNKQAQLDEKSKQLEKSYEELEILNKGKDRLLSIMTHDIKQPFNQTLGVLEVLSQYISDNPELHALIKEVKESVENDKKSVENLLIWSKSQFARIKAHPQSVNVYNLIKGLQKELHQSLCEKQIELEIQVDKYDEVYADPNQVEIILRNLITNAIKFSRKGGTLQLRSRALSDGVEITVKDQGVGMSKEQLKNLFDTKNHFSEKGTLNEAGTGLGLLIVFDFVKENKGQINVKSEPGKGSEFLIRFPAA